MSRQFLLVLLGSLVAVGLVVFLTVERNQQNVLHLDGKVTATRLVDFGDGSSLAMVDFDATNPTDVAFEVSEIQIEARKGEETMPARTFGKSELAAYLEFQKYTPPHPQIGYGELIKPRERARRMAAARFETNMASLKDWEFVVRLTDVNHRVAELKQDKEKGKKR